MIAFSCSSCGQSLKIKDEMAGRKGKCPQCGKPIQVPVPVRTTGSVWPPPPNELKIPPPAIPVTQAPQEDTHGPGPVPDVAPEDFSFLAPARGPGELGWLGSYRILKVLGAGGMGIVFLAEDSQLQRRVALKVMRGIMAANPAARQRFLRRGPRRSRHRTRSHHHDPSSGGRAWRALPGHAVPQGRIIGQPAQP